MMSSDNWKKTLELLESELLMETFTKWIKPLQPIESHIDGVFSLQLLAPNNFVLEKVEGEFKEDIERVISLVYKPAKPNLLISLGNNKPSEKSSDSSYAELYNKSAQNKSYLSEEYLFDRFVEGKSNHIAYAAALQAAENPGKSYNPLFIYGSTALGKTHLMQAVGNKIAKTSNNLNILYTTSERFLTDFVSSIRHKKTKEFKDKYRKVDVLLIDDIQFLAKREGTQEEFFHTFNTLYEQNKQIIITSDKFPQELNDIEDRLISRFSQGLTVRVEPPEFETRVAIIIKKIEELNKNPKNDINMPEEVAYFIAKCIRSNVRALEGGLKKVIIDSTLMGNKITIESAKISLQELISVQERNVSMDNIKKTVVNYFKISANDLIGKSRKRNLVRARQMAMALARELTNHSLPEIGESFNRDHSTTIHACNKVNELKESDDQIKEQYDNLVRILTI